MRAVSQTQNKTQTQPESPQAFLDPGEVLEEEYQKYITEKIINDIADFVEAFPNAIIYSVVTFAKDNSEQIERLCISFLKTDWAEELCRMIDTNLLYLKQVPDNVKLAAMTLPSVYRIIELYEGGGHYRLQIIIPYWG